MRQGVPPPSGLCPLPDDDERDDGAAVEPQVVGTVRAVNLRNEENGITLLNRRRPHVRQPGQPVHELPDESDLVIVGEGRQVWRAELRPDR